MCCVIYATSTCKYKHHAKNRKYIKFLLSEQCLEKTGATPNLVNLYHGTDFPGLYYGTDFPGHQNITSLRVHHNAII